jgi:hypothetical protein
MNSEELLWSAPGRTAIRNLGSWFDYFYPGNVRDYFGLETGSPCNGEQLSPSREHTAPFERYVDTRPEWKLGSPFAKFSEGDLRAGPFGYENSPDNWVGMFLMEELVNPLNPDLKALGEPSVLVDYVTYNDLPSTMANASANSGYRLVKYPLADKNDLDIRWNAHLPIIRLTEILYMLAECKMRAGDKAGAATLINDVRVRYFDSADPDPVTDTNLDDYRMLDEWMIEFLGEAQGRRRTDLVRFDKFVTEDWWDHEASNDETRNLFPIPTNAISGNPLLEQNPGY